MATTTAAKAWRDQLAGAVPILRWLPDYRRSRLRGDILAGAIVAALLVPQSLGYARIAGVPVEVGLYAVPLALLAYAVLGSSPQLIVGPASTVAIVSGSLVADIARDNPEDAVAITSALAIAAGIVLAATGLLRVAWLAEFLSKPIVTGFVFGLTLTIVIGELPTLLGISKPPGDLIGVLVRTVGNVDELHPATAIVGGLALVLLVGGRRVASHLPWGLMVVVAGVAASRLLDLEAEGVAVIGDISSGLPPLGLPFIPLDDLGAVAVGGASLALVALAEGLSATRLFATRGGYRVETERELVGMGASNVAAGLSGGLAVAGSLSKTAAADQAGSRSQVSGITAAGIVILVLVAFTWFFEDLPQSVLSAIVVAAVWGLMDVDAMLRYRRVRRADFVAGVVAATAVVVFGPLPGLGIAIVVSLLAIIYRSSRPRIEVLGKIKDEKAAWGRVRGHPGRHPVPGVVVVRLDAPLFWANAAAIEERLIAEVGKWEDTTALVLDLEATTQLDTTAADTVAHLHQELAALGIQLYLARVLHRVEAVLGRSGFLVDLGSEHVWHSISQCVRAATRHATSTADDGRDAPITLDQDDVEVIADDTDAPSPRLPGATGERRDNALGLYLHTIRDGRPREAASAYAGVHLAQHRSGVRDGAAGLIEYFEGLVDRHPVRDVEVVRSIEDGRRVFLHVIHRLDNGESAWVATDFFDTDADNRVIEQWGVVAPLSERVKSAHTTIDGRPEIGDVDRTSDNKAAVKKMIKKVLMPGGRPSEAARYFSTGYVRHNGEIAPGVESFHDLAGTPEALVYDRIVLLLGEGDFVATLCKTHKRGVEYAQTDVFRLDGGLIVEHWANGEPVLPREQWVNSGPF